MQTTDNLAALRAMRAGMKKPFGLVPTMGALHSGHASLIKRARAECGSVGVSVFVNPSQFSAGEDFGKYPRTLQKDLDLLQSLGVDLVYCPAVDSVYPAGYQTWIDVTDISAPLEGQCRPGHFRGVATVVAKLFNSFQPDKAYFGQKDAQQVAVLKRMVRDLDFPVDLVVCPTVREPDGLALSSRNSYLSAEERKAATVLYRALNEAKSCYEGGERCADVLRDRMRSVLRSEPLAKEQYVSVADPETLRELDTIERNALFSMAVRIGATRLIDNFLV
ncbi:MAG: pantoate--beta-alanine ligase [Acidobacteriota bacterium]|nr:pantoate--beta-alanine ligase [Acidobacteriota bacterium]